MQDLTTGSLTGHLLRTTAYMLVSMIFQTLYVLVDLYWVGRLGTTAVAAVGISGNLTFIVLAATQMLGVGTTTLVAHATGRRDQAQATVVFNQAQVLSIVVGIAFLAIALVFRDPYARAFSADDATTALTREYLLWFIPAMALQFGLIAMASALRGTGNFRPGMVVQTATVILNIVLAPVLIFGWGTGVALGVSGAAIATLIAIAIGVVWMTLYFYPVDAYLKFTPGDWAPRFRLWNDMVKIGLPAGAEFALLAVYLMIVYAVSKPFGAAAQAGFGIGIRILQACFLPVVALGFAVSPVAGQNFGARQSARVKQTFTTGASIAAAAMLLLALAVWVWADGMVRVFTADATAVAVGEEYLAHCRLQLRRLGRDLRELEHVPGDGQYNALADHVGSAHRDRGRARAAAGSDARLRAPMDLVHLGGGGRGPTGDESRRCSNGNTGSGSISRPMSGGAWSYRALFRYKLTAMPFIITDPCIGTKDSACVDVCPVDCIHPRKDEPEFETASMLYIHPDECIDCGACVPACPVAAIYDSTDSTPPSQKELIDANAVYRAGDDAAVSKAEEIVKRHMSAHPDLMAVAPAERAAAHAK